MNGQLHEHPVAELINQITEKGFSGALRVENKRVKAVVYFETGELIYATSNVRTSRLSEYVRKRGLMTAEQNGSSDFALAAALLAKRALTKESLGEIVTEQVTDVLRMILLWTEGEWSFDVRARLTESVRVWVEVKQLLIDASRRLDLMFAASRFTDPLEAISPVPDAMGSLNLSPTEGFLLSRVDGPMAISELATISGLREPDAQRTIYGLVLAGLLSREFPQSVFRDYDVRVPVSRKPREPTSKAKEELPGTSPEQPRDPVQELADFLDQAGNATSHYELLNISESGSASEVKQAYHSIARRFHPDRFHEIQQTELHARLESTFGTITQAYETLSNARLRASYDAKLAALRKVSQSVERDNPQNVGKPAGTGPGHSGERENNLKLAEQKYQEGLAALQLGQNNIGISCLSAAARLVPDQHRYRAHYGRALASDAKTRRLAEAELLAAIKLDPRNASYRVILAALYRDLGFQKRAIGELERALSLDPTNAEARAMRASLVAIHR